jgi:tRNA A-37 threonylcarbamoyl transferase component Bud32
MTAEDEPRTLEEDPALAETRLVPDGPAGGGASVVEDQAEPAETRVVADEAEPAETRVVSAEAEPGETRVVSAEAEPGETRVVAGEALPGETRVVSAEAEPAETRVVADEASPAETRVLDVPQSPARASTPMDADRGLAPGEILFGEYEIVNVLGVGGMGEVYRAKHRRLDEHRAIKVMHAELSKKKGASEFFYREAKALLAVRHPAVVHCHDLLSDDQGRVYLIMEMIEGIPLSKKMNEGPLSPDDVAVLGARIAHGLAAAHRKGVIHRDLSPDNIVLPNGRVQEAKIIDFGIAKLLEEGEGTILDGFKGKLSYASPEQLGFHGGAIDGRSDFYSLGLVLVAAARGKPMPMGSTVVDAVDARRNLTDLPDEIPIGLRSAIQPLLALDPADRPRYVDRLFVVPGGVEGGTDPEAFREGSARSGGRSSEKASQGGRVGSIVGVAAAGLLLIGGGLYLGLDVVRKPSEQGVPEGAAAPSATPVAPRIPVRVEVEPALPVRPLAEAKPESGSAPPTTEVAVNQPAIGTTNEPPTRNLTARDRLQIIGLINNARRALEENRLMSPAGDNAFDRYRKVLELDPSDVRAREGLRDIATRYVSLAEGALDRGDRAAARDFVERARRADDSYAGIDAVEGRLVR